MNDYIKNQLISVDEVVKAFGVDPNEVKDIFLKVQAKLNREGKSCFNHLVPRSRLLDYLDLKEKPEENLEKNKTIEIDGKKIIAESTAKMKELYPDLDEDFIKKLEKVAKETLQEFSNRSKEVDDA